MFNYNLARRTVHSDACTSVWRVVQNVVIYSGCAASHSNLKRVLSFVQWCFLLASVFLPDKWPVIHFWAHTQQTEHRYLFLIVQILDTPWALVGPCTVCLNCKMWFLLQLYSVYKLIWFFGGVNSLRWWNNVIERLLFICTYKVAYYLCYQ